VGEDGRVEGRGLGERGEGTDWGRLGPLVLSHSPTQNLPEQMTSGPGRTWVPHAAAAGRIALLHGFI
jgi:hypothetical protein